MLRLKSRKHLPQPAGDSGMGFGADLATERLQLKFMKKRRKKYCLRGHKRTPENVGSDDHCKICKRELASSRDNLTKNRKRQAQRHERNQRLVCEYLRTHPCVDCGETDILVLEFDHVKPKFQCVSSLMAYSWENILGEIAKCDVVCANDHARRTAKRANTLRWRLQQ